MHEIVFQHFRQGSGQLYRDKVTRALKRELKDSLMKAEAGVAPLKVW